MFPNLPIHFYAYSGLINGLLALFLGLMVYLRGRKNPLFQTFLLLNLSIAVWSLAYWRWLLQTEAEPALLWTRILDIGAIFIPITFFHWVMTLLERGKKNRVIITVGYLASLVFLVFSPTTHFIRTVEPALGFPFWPKPGIVYTVFLFGSFAGLTILALLNLFDAYQKSAGLRRLQLKFVLIGFLLGFLGGSTNFLLWYGIPLPPIGNPLVAAYPLLFSYAIIKHRLLDIRLALREILARFSLSVLMIGLYLALKNLWQNLTGDSGSVNDYLVFLFLIFLAATYGTLNKYTRLLTDRFLFAREYSHQEMIRKLGQTAAQSLDVKQLTDNIAATLKEVMRVHYVGFVLLPKNEDSAGLKRNTPEIMLYGLEAAGEQWWRTSFLLRRLREQPAVLSYDEIKREIDEGGGSTNREIKEVWGDMRQIHAAVVVPLVNSTGVSGAIVLGEKRGGNAFTSSDFDTFEMLMYQAGVALENALLFSEIQNFNVKLRSEVSRATTALANRNRRLTILRRLDMITMNTQNLDEMCQKIIDTVSWEMAYEGGLIALLDNDGDTLRAYAVSKTPALQKALAYLPDGLKKMTVSLSRDATSPLVKALRTRKPTPTANFVELYSPPLPRSLAQTMEKITEIHQSVVWPLSAKGRVLGVVVFGLPKSYETLSGEEQEMLSAFMDEAGIAIENVTLYIQARKDKLTLEKAYEKLQELDKMKDEFVSITSHELRTPMSSIKGYIWMLENKGGTLSEKQHGYLEAAKRGADRMINLINDMLNVSRIEQGKIGLRTVGFDLKEIVAEVAEGLKLKAGEKGLALSVKAESVLAEADPDRVREVIGNLIENAIKYTGIGSIIVTVKKVQGKAKVSVKDTGKGIAADDLPRLFQKFGRLERSFATVAETSGTGLGLYISKLLVEKMGGQIGVSSVPARGSTFYFTLPLAKKGLAEAVVGVSSGDAKRESEVSI